MGDIKKKILLLSTGDVNGAYEYVYKMAKLFKNEGHQVAMIVKAKTKSDIFVIVYIPPFLLTKKKNIFIKVFFKVFFKIKNKFLSFFKKPNIIFETQYDFISIDETKVNVSAEQIINQIQFTPDYIFSGMTDRFMNSTDLLNLQQLTDAKVYNISVDMNHFTGGCHFAWDCKGYINGCDVSCPAILSEYGKEVAKINFETKLKNARKGNFKILTGSGWTLNQAKSSMIYRNQSHTLNINSLIDTTVLNNKNRNFAKQIFNLKEDTFYILMGCQNSNSKRKGFEYLLESLKILHQNINESQGQKINVLIVSREISESFNEIPFDKQHIDYINDYRLLSLLYQAADVFVNSSIEDSGPMMVSEALACGTPVVGFDMGVVNNMVISGYNGYKAKLKDPEDLSQGIKEILELSKDEYNQYSLNAVKQVEEYSSFEYAYKVFNEIFSNSSDY
jgi:glycosyltransferase involved in cell wall biosynthesis